MNNFQRILTEWHKDEKTVNDCKNYKKDSGTCTTGCPKAKVKKGNSCPFEDEQDKCKCYK